MSSDSSDMPVEDAAAAANQGPAIKVSGLSKRYRMYKSPTHKFVEAIWNSFSSAKKTLCHEHWALNGIDLEIPKGTTLGIIGRNGSGKSTLLQIIAGVLRATSGKVETNGRIAALLELGTGFNREFTGRENVLLQGAIMGISKREMLQRIPEIEAFAEIGTFIDEPVKTYSSGMYVRLAFAVAINVDAEILIVDEALAVGDDMFRRRCYAKLEELQESGKTILFVTHNMQAVTSLCTRALLLEGGKAVLDSTPKAIVNKYYQLIAEIEEVQFRSNAQGSLQPRKDAEKKTEIEQSDELRFGNGGAEILKVQIENEQGEVTEHLNCGEDFFVSIEVRFLRDTKEPVIGFMLKTLRGIDVYGTSTQLLENAIGPAKSEEIHKVRFCQRNTLGPETYSLSAAVSEIENNSRFFQDRRLDLLTIRVTGKRRTYGLIDIVAEVEIYRD